MEYSISILSRAESWRAPFQGANQSLVLWAKSEAVGYAVKRTEKNTELRRQNSEYGIRLGLSRKI
jgi:hypothetical protein